MALVRKKNPNWFPSENKELLVGESIDIGDYRRLVELGDAELIDEMGNVLPLPGTVFVCGICFEQIPSHGEYVSHIMQAHSSKTAVLPEAPEEKETETTITVPDSFGEKMKKARAEARAKREAAKKQA